MENRRTFLKTALACAALIPTKSNAAQSQTQDRDESLIYSTCLGCNARCGVRVHLSKDQNTILRVSGNPYHPYNSEGSPLAYDTDSHIADNVPAPVCGKAHEAVNQMYDPYRLLRPLKRIGPRGSGAFRPIEWEELIKEVADGGQLFSEIGDDKIYPGIRSVLSAH